VTTPTTNLGFSSIQTEFGGTRPLHMNAYYKGGANVPSGQATSGTDGSPVPTSGVIRFGMFRGLTKVTSGVGPGGGLGASNTSALSPGTATALCGWRYDGQVFTQDENGITYRGNWYTPTTPSSVIQNYWFRTTVTSGALTSGGSGVGTWQKPTINSDWDVGASAHTTGKFASDSRSASGHIDISADGGTTILATWSFSCNSFISSAA
jgi:hypothetical protein